jgi:hypothetical protein
MMTKVKWQTCLCAFKDVLGNGGKAPHILTLTLNEYDAGWRLKPGWSLWRRKIPLPRFFIQPLFLGIATGWTVRGSNPGGGEIFRILPDRPWGPPSLLYNGYRVSFPGVKRPGRGVDHRPSSSVGVKERVELYLYSPSGPSWPVIGWTLPLPGHSVVTVLTELFCP